MSYLCTNNKSNVLAEIKRKNCHLPLQFDDSVITNVVTDYDTFPYPRWFRGEYNSDCPIIADREAGWRPQNNECYKAPLCSKPYPYPNHCFEAAFSTVYPCFPPIVENDSVLLNKVNVIHYR